MKLQHWCSFLLAIAQLIIEAASLRCLVYDEDSGIGKGRSVRCTSGPIVCYEALYGYSTQSHLTYRAGCGRFVFIVAVPANARVTKQTMKYCHEDECNTQVRLDLLGKYRICYHAKASRSFHENIVACQAGETKCYFEKSKSAVPFYNAGCGDCPDYTLNCFTCRANKCNESDSPTLRDRTPQSNTDSSPAPQISKKNTPAAIASPPAAASAAAAAVACIAATIISWLADA